MNLLEYKKIFLLSLWKTYVGTALGVSFDMFYVEAVGYTMLGAGISVFATLYFEQYVTRAFKSLMRVAVRRNAQKPPKFKPVLRKALIFYKRYGFWGLMALTPILIGIPMGILIAVRLGTTKHKIAVTVLFMSLFWSSLSYIVTLNGLEQLGI
ncbi:MAG: hypothetical protein ACI9LM_005048 [Alteromonadaceae bacterium]|jgi:hypothetical protein